MTILASRTYSGALNLQSLFDLLVAVRPTDRVADYPGVVDLHELLTLRSVQDRTRLWFDAAAGSLSNCV
jgi:hypothetical protein